MYIYVLIDPVSDEIRYVGKCVNTRIRLQRHIRESKNCRTHKECWIKGLCDKGHTPKLEVIEECSLGDWIEREIFYISYFKYLGFNLTNLTPGGDGITKHSPETIEKLRLASTGRKHTDEAKSKVTLALLNRDPEIYRRISEKQKGRKMPIIGVEKVAQAHRKAIFQFTLDGKFIADFKSLKEAKEFTGVNNISRALSGRLPRAGGYIWILENEFTPEKLQSLVNAQSEVLTPGKKGAKILHQLDKSRNLIKEWPSTAEAARELGLSFKAISNAARGKSKSCGGFIWEFKTQ